VSSVAFKGLEGYRVGVEVLVKEAFESIVLFSGLKPSPCFYGIAEISS